MTDEPPLLVPRRIRDRLSRAVASLRQDITADIGDRTPCAVEAPGAIDTIEGGRAWIEAVVAALPVRPEGRT